jgi:branched-chain amino acid transport system permease protein
MIQFFQFASTGILVGSLYALIALGLVIIYKSSSIFNFAHGDFMLAGVYVSLTLMSALGINPWISLIVAMIVSLVLGFIIERGFLSPLVGQPLLSAIMMTLGLSVFLKGIIGIIWGPAYATFPPMLPQGTLNIGGVLVSIDQLCAFVVALILFGIFSVFFWRTNLGLAMRATSEEHRLTESLGINVKNMLAVTWGIAFVVATIGGVLLATISGGVNMTFGDSAVKAFPAVIVGGLESIPGALLGGVIVGVTEFVGGGYMDPLFPTGAVREIVPYVVLLIILLIMPYGLFGQKKIERV